MLAGYLVASKSGARAARGFDEAATAGSRAPRPTGPTDLGKRRVQPAALDALTHARADSPRLDELDELTARPGATTARTWPHVLAAPVPHDHPCRDARMTLPERPDSGFCPGSGLRRWTPSCRSRCCRCGIETRFRPAELYAPVPPGRDPRRRPCRRADRARAGARQSSTGCASGGPADDGGRRLRLRLARRSGRPVARRLGGGGWRPSKQAAAPRAPVADDRPLAPPPKFPKVTTLTAPRRRRRGCCPTAWPWPATSAASSWARGGPRRSRPSSGSRRGRSRTATASTAETSCGLGAGVAVDFEAAAQVGMGLRIPLHQRRRLRRAPRGRRAPG